MVASPFLWERMRQPGRAVPFMFQEFAGAAQAVQSAASEALQLPNAAPTQAGAGMTAAEVASAVAEAVHAILGPAVRLSHCDAAQVLNYLPDIPACACTSHLSCPLVALEPPLSAY